MSAKAGVAKGGDVHPKLDTLHVLRHPAAAPSEAAGGVIPHGLDAAHLSAAQASTAEPSALGGCPSVVPWMQSIAPHPMVPICH